MSASVGPAVVLLTADTLPVAVRAVAALDPGLAALVARDGLPPLWKRPEGFVTLARIVLEQQVSLESALTLWRRLDAEIPGGFQAQALASLGVEGLRQLGVTRQKASYLHALAVAEANGTLRLDLLEGMADADVLARLTSLHGIGPWTAAVYALFVLGRADAWPPGDLALHLAIQSLDGLATPPSREEANARALAWAPWRAAAARILWHGYLRERGRSVADVP